MTTTTNKINANTIVCEPFSIEMSEEYCYDNVSDTMVLVTVWECYMNGEIMPKSSTKRAYGGMTATFNRRIDAVKFLLRDSAWHNASDVQIVPQEALEALVELVTTAATVEETQEQVEEVTAVAKTEETQEENFSAMSVETLIVLKKSAYETYNMYLNGQIKMTQDQLKAHNARACTISEELRRKLNEEEQTQEPEPITEEIATVAESLNLPVDEVAKVYAIAQEYKQLQEADRATFAAESALETVPIQRQEEVQHMEQSKQIILKIWFFPRPEMSLQKGAEYLQKYFPHEDTLINVGTVNGPARDDDHMIYIRLRQDDLTQMQRDYLHNDVFSARYINDFQVDFNPIEIVGSPETKTPEQEEVQQNKPIDELRQLVYTAEASLQSALETLEPVYKDHVLLSVVASIRSAITDLDDMREKLPEQSEIMIYIEKAVAKAFVDDGTTPAGIYVDKKYKEELQDKITVYAWNSAIEIQGQDVDIVFQSAEEMGGELVTVFHDNE